MKSSGAIVKLPSLNSPVYKDIQRISAKDHLDPLATLHSQTLCQTVMAKVGADSLDSPLLLAATLITEQLAKPQVFLQQNPDLKREPQASGPSPAELPYSLADSEESLEHPPQASEADSRDPS